MYIPAGSITLLDVIEQVAFDIDAAAMKPVMPDALSRAEKALQEKGPWSVRSDNPEGLAIMNWHASAGARQRWTRDRARQRLQQPLGNGSLSAIALLPDGSIVCTPDRLWRTTEGSRALQTGCIMTGGLFVIDERLGHPKQCPVFVKEKEFRRWREGPEDPQMATAQTQDDRLSAVHRKPATRRRERAGGRPPRADWPIFDQQVLRVMISVGCGNLTRTELRQQMKAFAAENTTNPPDDRTIDRRLDDLVPDDVLAKD
jgi:hypothetical protein